ncbi:MAG: hypothetical protein ACLQGJ_11960 [Candidatus Dormibacteria bacterium]
MHSAAMGMLCSLAVAGCGSVTGLPSLTASPVSTATPGPSAASVETRLLVQQGLSIGLASTVIQSQVTVLEDALLGSTGCKPLTAGSGSSKVLQTSTSGSVTTADVDVYYDASCSQPYIVAAATLTGATGSITVKETATYYGPSDATLGVLSLAESMVVAGTSEEISSVTVDGTGTFTPQGGEPVVSLGLECEIPAGSSQPPPFGCSGAIEQPFPQLGLSLASLTPLTITLTPLAGSTGSSYGVAFAGTQSTLETGPAGSLSITTPTATTFAIGGTGTVTGSDSISGNAALFALFTPAPTSWSVVNANDKTSFTLSIVSGSTQGALTGSVTTAAGKSLAQLTLDQSGTGTISYTGGSSAAVTSWTLGG